MSGGRRAELLEVVQVGPVTGQPHQNATGGHADFCSDFDQPCSPGAGLTFAERVTLATPVVTLPTTMFGLRLGR